MGKKLRVDDVAIAHMREHKITNLWYGVHAELLFISDDAGCKKGHIINRIAGVMSAVARSKKFKKSGYIIHLGRRYNTYEVRSKWN